MQRILFAFPTQYKYKNLYRYQLLGALGAEFKQFVSLIKFMIKKKQRKKKHFRLMYSYQTIRCRLCLQMMTMRNC